MFNDTHLTRGELSDGDGGVILILGNSFHQEKPDNNFTFHFFQSHNNEFESKVCLFDGGFPIASTSYEASKSDVVIHANRTRVHEALRGRGISTQLTALCLELGLRRWRELSGMDLYAEQYPDSISILAGTSEVEADHARDWISEQFYIDRGKLELVAPIIHEDIPIQWSVKVSSSEVGAISAIVNDITPDGLIEGAYKQIYER